MITGAMTAILGMALIGLISCSSGESTSNTVAPGGSQGLQGPIVFVNNTATSSLTSVALKGDSGNAVVNTIPATDFEGVALGDMQLSDGDWVFMNLGAAGKVAAIDPKTAATPFRKLNLATGTRPVHLYRDPNDGEVIWIMNDGDNSTTPTPTLTPGDDLINCNNPSRPGGPLVGGSVTAVHNSHFGPGGVDPTVLGTVCVLADGHKVAAFSSGAGVPKRVFVSSEDAGEIAVIDDDEASPEYGDIIARIDLCQTAKETAPCDDESLTGPTTPFTPNASAPHGIRWSKLTQKVYSIQEGYGEISEIDPTTFAVTPIFDLAGSPYTTFGISPNGRFLLLRGDAAGTKLGVIDLGTAGKTVTNFNIPELAGTSPGSFKFSPDSNRFYILAGNAATATKKNQLFAFDSSTLTAATPVLTLLREIPLVATGAHSFDILAQTPTGAPVGTPGEAKYIVVSNSIDNSLSIINATDNQIKQTVQSVGSTVGSILGGVMIFAPGTGLSGNQASS